MQRRGQIRPKVQATPEHPHLLDALFHVAEHTGLRQANARNHRTRTRNPTAVAATVAEPVCCCSAAAAQLPIVGDCSTAAAAAAAAATSDDDGFR